MTLPKKVIDLTGQRFGRLTVVQWTGTKRGSDYFWLCRCDCGNDTTTITRSLRHGETKSCGCLNREKAKTLRPIVHGHAKTGQYHPLYATWATLRQRCSNPNNKKYPRYGGRGIKFCERWQLFENFLSDMGDRPVGTSIDRIDSDGDYTPENCRWATPVQQSHNREYGRFIEFNGKTMRLFEWARECNVSPIMLHNRLHRGWSIERALTSSIDDHDFSNKIIEFNGHTLSVSQWVEKTGINERALYYRLHRGWSIERALTTPVRHRAKS